MIKRELQCRFSQAQKGEVSQLIQKHRQKPKDTKKPNAQVHARTSETSGKAGRGCRGTGVERTV